MSKLKNALLLSSSGGSLSQEVAIIDLLLNQKKIEINEDDTFIAGFGSGALTLVALNACFRKDNPCSWDVFFKEGFLNSISDEETFIKIHPIHWSTLPLRRKIAEFLTDSGYAKVADLPFVSTILAFSVDMQKTIWLKSNNQKEASGDLSDILMATSAIPVLFPSQQINSINEDRISIPDGAYIEGAMEGIFKKVKRQLKEVVNDNGPFEKLFIVSPQRHFESDIITPYNYHRMTLDEKDNFSDYLDNISMTGFLRFLNKLQRANSKKKIAKSIFVCMPEMLSSLDLLDFSDQRVKYKETYEWFELNMSRLMVELDEFVAEKTETLVR
jgi:hypothetical protein